MTQKKITRINEDFYDGDYSGTDPFEHFAIFYQDHRKDWDEYEELLESESIVRDFDKIFNDMTDFIINDILNNDALINWYHSIRRKYPQYYYQIESEYCYKNIYDPKTHTKDIKVDYYINHKCDNDWYKICFCILYTINGMEFGTNVIREENPFKPNIVNIYINIRKCKFMHKDTIKELLLHELTHVARQVSDPKFNPQNMDIQNIINEFNLPQNIFDEVQGYCYLLSSDEQNAFLNQIHQAIINMDDLTVDAFKKFESKYSQSDFINGLIKCYADICCQTKYENLLEFVCTANYDNYIKRTQILLLSYYIKHIAENVNTIRGDKNKLRIRYKKLSKDFMVHYTTGGVDISKKEFYDIKEPLRRYVDAKIKVYYTKLHNIAYKAYKERLGDVNSCSTTFIIIDKIGECHFHRFV